MKEILTREKGKKRRKIKKNSKILGEYLGTEIVEYYGVVDDVVEVAECMILWMEIGWALRQLVL